MKFRQRGLFMSRATLAERINKGLLILDGAMGTELFSRGIEPGKCNDYLNIESPEIISDIHRAYLDAGSDTVITNTFGANKYALTRHGLADSVEQINTAGAKIARKAADEDRYILGNIGPTGDFLEPLGTLKPEQCRQAFIEQARALVAGGVDGLIIETMTALEEIRIATEAVKSVTGKLPVFITMAFEKAGDSFKTMMGLDVESAFSTVVSLGVEGIGFNCGTISLEEYIELAEKYMSLVKACGKNVAIIAEPNAGQPQLVDGKAVYNVPPADYAQAVEKIHLAGVNIIGGCCGTSPAHIEAVAKELRK